jgi:hypothetical protein
VFSRTARPQVRHVSASAPTHLRILYASHFSSRMPPPPALSLVAIGSASFLNRQDSPLVVPKFKLPKTRTTQTHQPLAAVRTTVRRPQPPCGSHRPQPLVGEGSVRDSIPASGRILTVIKDRYFVRFYFLHSSQIICSPFYSARYLSPECRMLPHDHISFPLSPPCSCVAYLYIITSPGRGEGVQESMQS